MIAALNKVYGETPSPQTNFRPKWSFLPDEIGKEYQDGGATLLELSLKYGVSTLTISQKLAALQIGARHGNFNPARGNKHKLTDAQIQWILEQDLENVSHSEIASHVNVTRERVRQICLRANHATRRERMTNFLQREEAISARKIARFAIIKEAAEMYRAGASFAAIHAFLRPKAPPTTNRKATISGATLVSNYRKRYPDLFPYRRPPKERTNDS